MEPEEEARIARFDPAPAILPAHACGYGRAVASVPQSCDRFSVGDRCLISLLLDLVALDEVHSHMMESSLIWWKKERSHMMAKELADLVGATKLLVFMCWTVSQPMARGGAIEGSGSAAPHSSLHRSGVGAQSELLQHIWRRRSSLHRIMSHMVEFVHMLTWGVRRAQTAGEKREKGEEND